MRSVTLFLLDKQGWGGEDLAQAPSPAGTRPLDVDWLGEDKKVLRSDVPSLMGSVSSRLALWGQRSWSWLSVHPGSLLTYT